MLLVTDKVTRHSTLSPANNLFKSSLHEQHAVTFHCSRLKSKIITFILGRFLLFYLILCFTNSCCLTCYQWMHCLTVNLSRCNVVIYKVCSQSTSPNLLLPTAQGPFTYMTRRALVRNVFHSHLKDQIFNPGFPSRPANKANHQDRTKPETNLGSHTMQNASHFPCLTFAHKSQQLYFSYPCGLSSDPGAQK